MPVWSIVLNFPFEPIAPRSPDAMAALTDLTQRCLDVVADTEVLSGPALC